MFLSCPAKKGTKECGIGEALRKGGYYGMIATGNHSNLRFAARSTTLPYVPHPPHRQPTTENVPIFVDLPEANLQVLEL